MEEALNLVKHHQYISQAVDGKKAKREYEASVNAVQSPSEARVKQLISSGILQQSSRKALQVCRLHQRRKKKLSLTGQGQEKWSQVKDASS